MEWWDIVAWRTRTQRSRTTGLNDAKGMINLYRSISLSTSLLYERKISWYFSSALIWRGGKMYQTGIAYFWKVLNSSTITWLFWQSATKMEWYTLRLVTTWLRTKLGVRLGEVLPEDVSLSSSYIAWQLTRVVCQRFAVWSMKFVFVPCSPSSS